MFKRKYFLVLLLAKDQGFSYFFLFLLLLFLIPGQIKIRMYTVTNNNNNMRKIYWIIFHFFSEKKNFIRISCILSYFVDDDCAARKNQRFISYEGQYTAKKTNKINYH